jgi:hypothetical protein
LHGLVVGVEVHASDEHRRVLARGRDDHFFRARFYVFLYAKQGNLYMYIYVYVRSL